MPVSIVDIFKLGKLMICKRMTGFNNYFFFFQIKPHKFDEYTAFLFFWGGGQLNSTDLFVFITRTPSILTDFILSFAMYFEFKTVVVVYCFTESL